MKNSLLSIICFWIALAAAAAPPQDVVIQNLVDIYKFVPDKSGAGLDRVEHTSKTTFRGSKQDAEASAIAYYNDFITIDKVSADKKYYGPYIPDDIFYSDSKACIMVANLKKANDTRDVAYRRTFTRPELFNNVMIYNPYTVEHGEMVFEIPLSLADRYTLRENHFPGDAIKRTTETRNNTLYIRYAYDNMAPPEVQKDAPSLHLTAPAILILGHFRDTDELYKYLHGYLPTEDPGMAEVRQKALEVTRDCTSDAERIKAVTDYVHRTVRYVAVENGELAHKPDLASEVLRKAYGDCKGSATLIKEMLCALGIDARRVWLGTDDIDTPWTDVPNISSGNHMIAAVVSGDSVTYIDGTLKYAPAGSLGVSESGVQTIIEGDADTYMIGCTPEYTPDRNLETAKWTVNIDDSATLSYHGSIEISGMRFGSFLAAVDDTPPARRNDLYGRILARGIKGGHAEDVTCELSTDGATLQGTVTQGGMVKSVGERTLVELNPSPDILNLRFLPADRKAAGMVKSTAETVVEITLCLPDGVKVDTLPEAVEVSGSHLAGSISDTVAADGRSVTRTFRLITRRGVVPPDAIKRFNADVRQLSKGCSASIVLKSGD